MMNDDKTFEEFWEKREKGYEYLTIQKDGLLWYVKKIAREAFEAGIKHATPEKFEQE